MDDVSYAEQTAELQNRITTLRSRRLKLISEDEDTHYIEDLRWISLVEKIFCYILKFIIAYVF